MRRSFNRSDEVDGNVTRDIGLISQEPEAGLAELRHRNVLTPEVDVRRHSDVRARQEKGDARQGNNHLELSHQCQ
jgi:hypothetical protein